MNMGYSSSMLVGGWRTRLACAPARMHKISEQIYIYMIHIEGRRNSESIFVLWKPVLKFPCYFRWYYSVTSHNRHRCALTITDNRRDCMTPTDDAHATPMLLVLSGGGGSAYVVGQPGRQARLRRLMNAHREILGSFQNFLATMTNGKRR